jgi:Arabinofuranosyltransferase A C terminal
VTDMVRYGFQSFQNRWFQLHMITLPFDISTHWRWMAGLVFLIGMAPQNRLARVILGIFAALIGYQILGHIGMYSLFPLLHVRMIGLEEYLLALGFVLGVIELFRAFRGYLHSAFEKVLPVAFMTVVCFGMGIGFMWEKFNEGTKEAANTVVPSLVVFPEFNAMCHGQVFLTNRYELAAYRPMFLFLCQNAHYSHPASRYRERVKFLVLLCKSRDSDFVSWMLQYNRYDRVDHVLLDDNKIVISDDNFPHQPNHIYLDATFDPGIFDGPYFEQDSLFPEIQHVRPMPADSWKKFSPEQLRLAALFSDQDRDEIRAMVPGMVMKAMEKELHLRTTDYPLWQRSFWDRFMGGYGHQDAALRLVEHHQRKLAFERILKLPAVRWADRMPEDAAIYYKAADTGMTRWLEQWNGPKGMKKRLRFFDSIEALRSSGARHFWFSTLDLPEMRASESIQLDDNLSAGQPSLGDFLRRHSEYEIIIAGKDECTTAPSQATRSYFREIGSSFDSLKFRESYVLHLNQGEVIYERHDRVRITYDSPGKKPVRVRSGGLFSGNVASISVDGREMALNGRGLNVVVLDQDRNVVSSAVFDTYADDREQPLFVSGAFLPPK